MKTNFKISLLISETFCVEVEREGIRDHQRNCCWSQFLWRSYRWNCVGICVVEPGFAIFLGNFWQDMFPALQVRALQLPNFSFCMLTSWKLDDAAEHVYHLLDLELLSCSSNSKYRDWFRLRDWESTFWRRFGFARCLPICALLWSRLDACVLDLESCKYQVVWMEYSTWRWQLDVPTFHGWNVGANGLYYTFLRLQVVVTYDFAVLIGFHHRWTDYILNICIFQNGVDFTWEWTSYKIIFSRNANVLKIFSEAAGLKHRNSKRLSIALVPAAHLKLETVFCSRKPWISVCKKRSAAFIPFSDRTGLQSPQGKIATVEINSILPNQMDGNFPITRFGRPNVIALT